MRLAWYAGASSALAVAVVLSAFHQRANFYSAMVYLSESNFCLLALVNFVYILYGAFMYGLQRLCFGPLRAIEVDQLSDRAWVAITETCLAMTIFREEIGAWFLVMFTLLVTGKVWGWIGDGRLEVLEQQPPANPRLFHTRLVVSLLMSTLYDVFLLRYSISTVVQQARPNMMVMFLFEFAVLSASSLRTNARYLLTVIDAQIVAAQTSRRLFERRVELGRQMLEILNQREADVAAGREPSVSTDNLPDPNAIDELDIEVPGWEAKGQWILVLELVIDFIKLSIYVTFFAVLLMFYGLPIHIIRDVYITASAFFKRLSSLLKYRRAMHSMNSLQDAAADDLGREDTCIICREEMRIWDPQANPGAVERSRPKKLPCGHILHLGCLKSWLERQQVCPTCRRPVLADGNQPAQNGQDRPAQPPGQGQQQPQPGQAPHQAPQGAPAQQDNRGANGGAAPARPGHRAYNFGPFRLEFIRHDPRNPQALDAILNRGRGAEGAAEAQAPAGAAQAGPSQVLSPGFDQLVNRELASLQSLQLMQHELQTAQLLLAELSRLRQLRQQAEQLHAQGHAHTQPSTPTQAAPQMPLPQTFPPQHTVPSAPSLPFSPYPPRPPQTLTRFGPRSTTAIPAGSAELPEGVSLPPGWSMLPLSRMDAPAPAGTPPPQQAPEERRETPVLAPEPRPAWGGPSQLFPGEERRDEQGENSKSEGAAVDVKGRGEKDEAKARCEEAGPSSQEEGEREEREEEKGKGKGRAVSVEDVEE